MAAIVFWLAGERPDVLAAEGNQMRLTYLVLLLVLVKSRRSPRKLLPRQQQRQCRQPMHKLRYLIPQRPVVLLPLLPLQLRLLRMQKQLRPWKERQVPTRSRLPLPCRLMLCPTWLQQMPSRERELVL